LIQKGKILKAQFLLRTQFTLLLVFVCTLKHSAARYQHSAGTDTSPGRGVGPPGDREQFKEAWNVWRLATRGVPPGDICKDSGIWGASRLAVCVPRQAFLKW